MRWPLWAALTVWVLGCLLAPPAWATTATPPGTVILGSTTPTFDGDTLRNVWLDTQGSATIEEAVQARFESTGASTVHRLAAGNALWIRLQLMRTTERPVWLLAIPSPDIEYVNVWQRDPNGRWRGQPAGLTVAVNQWSEPGRYPTFRLDLPLGAPREVYVQVRSTVPTSVPLRLAAGPDHTQRQQLEYLGLGMIFGALVLLIGACLSQSWLHRETMYGWYAAYALATTLCVLAYTGVGGHLLWSGWSAWAYVSRGCLTLVAAGLALVFVRDLTGISARHRLLDRLTLWGGPLGVVLAGAIVAMPRPVGLVMLTVYVMFAMGLNLLVAWLSWRRADKVGLWVLAAYLPLSIALPLTLLRVMGWLPLSFFTQHAVVLGMGLQVPLLLIALSIRSRERHGAEIREQALSSQDALTGLLAPHLFHDRLRQVVKRFRRDRDNAAIIFVDLVNYPRIKAFYGTAVAEQSLLRSVIKLRRLVRDVDTVSRIGEARFGVILEGVSARAAVTDRAARLIAAGLMPLAGLKPDVTLQFHIASVLLGERIQEAGELTHELGALLASMSPRTRRPIRYLEPHVTQPAPLEVDSMAGSLEADSQPGENALASNG